MYKTLITSLMIAEGIACITGLLSWKKARDSVWKYFIIYLLFVFTSELFGLLCMYRGWKEIDQLYFTFVVIPAEFIFFYFLFAYHSTSKSYRRFAYLSVLFYLLSLFIENTGTHRPEFFSISYTVGNLLLLLLIFMYLYKYLQSDELIQIRSNPLIYVSIGLLIFYIGAFPFYGLKNYLWSSYKVIGTNYWYFATILNCLMYCMFTISFLWGKHKSISSSS
ncbi:MAG: hypothetical protein IT257_09560 [Chitinophagaceae bacterium]|nr:hypothetical protein [Chitinophagaceae bacterium]